jgi:thioesterase domain-containing protein/SAM-dependent methyltransferase/acyl carrier protein
MHLRVLSGEPASGAVESESGTIERVMRLRPRRVLEIGCGAGTLLLRAAPHCVRYVGTESSAAVLKQLRARVQAAGLADRVGLIQRDLGDWTGLERESANLVLLNSVTQYLPTVEHLVELLDRVTRSLAPGGAIFLSDVRNLDLLVAFHASAELRDAPPALPVDDLGRRIKDRVAAETELLVTPGFFTALPRRLYRIRKVEVTPKRGPARDDLDAFRYDVTLHTEAPEPSPEPAWDDWTAAGWSVERLRKVLTERRPDVLALGSVPNARTLEHAWTPAALATPNVPATCGELVAAGSAVRACGVEPEVLWKLGEELGYWVDLSWRRAGSSGQLDVLFRTSARPWDPGVTWPPDESKGLKPWRSYANQPMTKPKADGILPAVRDHLRDRLPDFMMPAAFVVLDTLPLSPNGKVDRRALRNAPKPSTASEASFAPPRTSLEESLAAIWRDLLGVQAVGLDDNFFELGGHSLLAVRLFADIERTFGRKLPLSTLFQAPTLGKLAEVFEQSPSGSPSSALAMLQPRGSRPPLFVIHGIYGDVLEYRDLVSRLGDDQPVYGLEAPLSENDGSVLRTIEQLASGYVAEMRRRQPVGPYFLCGYCWAGTVAFEMACQLRRSGEEVALLALIDAVCPGNHHSAPIADRVTRRGRNLGSRIGRNLRRLTDLQAAMLPRFLWDRAVSLGTELAGSLAYRWSIRLGRPLLPAFRRRRQALLYAGRAYRPPMYPGLVTLLRAEAAASTAGEDPRWGWDRVARGGVELHLVPGGHHDLLKEPNVARIAATLQACLERAGARQSEPT